MMLSVTYTAELRKAGEKMLYCDCNACEKSENCPYKNLYQRLPREYYPGALGLCPKLKEAVKNNE